MCSDAYVVVMLQHTSSNKGGAICADYYEGSCLRLTNSTNLQL